MIMRVDNSLMSYEVAVGAVEKGVGRYATLNLERVSLPEEWGDLVQFELHMENINCGKTFDPFLYAAASSKPGRTGSNRFGATLVIGGTRYEQCGLSGFWRPGPHWDGTPDAVRGCFESDKLVATDVVFAVRRPD